MRYEIRVDGDLPEVPVEVFPELDHVTITTHTTRGSPGTEEAEGLVPFLWITWSVPPVPGGHGPTGRPGVMDPAADLTRHRTEASV